MNDQPDTADLSPGDYYFVGDQLRVANARMPLPNDARMPTDAELALWRVMTRLMAGDLH